MIAPAEAAQAPANISLVRWGLLRHEAGEEVYLCGELGESGDLVRSSAIQHFNYDAMWAQTKSGRHYVLTGPPDVSFAMDLANMYRSRGMLLHDVTLQECARRGLMRITAGICADP